MPKSRITRVISHNQLKTGVLFRNSSDPLFYCVIFMHTQKIGRKDNFSRSPAVLPEPGNKYYDKYHD